MHYNRRAISQKLALWLLLIIAILEGTLVAAAYVWQSRRIDVAIQNQHDEITRITDSLVMPLWDLDRDQVKRLGQVINQNIYVDALEITSPEGHIFFRSVETPSHGGQKIIDLTYRDTPIGRIKITFGDQPGRHEKNLLLANLLLIYSASLILVFLLIRPLLKRIIQSPISRVGQAMSMVAKGDYQRSLALEAEEELAEIVDAFGDMTNAIQNREGLIKDSELKFKEIFNATNEGIMILDATRGVIMDVNETVCDMLELDAQALKQYAFMDLISVEHHEVISEGFTKASSLPQIIECQLKKGQNQYFWAEIAIKESEIRGEKKILIAIRDVSEKKEAAKALSETEERLRQAQKMEAVGQLAGGIAHDFNNLLQVINGHSQLVLDDLDESHELHADIMPIAQAGERAAELVKQLLTFSRRQIIQPKQLNLNDVINDLIKMIRRLIGEDIEFCFETNCSSLIRADRGMLDQILINLCVNARDAMPSGGKLVIRTDDVSFDEQQAEQNQWMKPGNYVAIAIEDCGIGMDLNTLNHIFEPFFTTKEQGKGTGLGLAMVYGIVRQHDGLIHVESEPGKGTTFYLYFPIDELQVPEEQEEEEPVIQASDKTILLAEDEPLVQDLAYQMLDKAGYTVIRASDGLEAIRKFHEHANEINILLLDVIMPGKRGREVMLEIRKTHPDVPVIFVSGYSESNIDSKFVLEEGLSLVNKPFKRNDLISKIENVLKN